MSADYPIIHLELPGDHFKRLSLESGRINAQRSASCAGLRPISNRKADRDVIAVLADEFGRGVDAELG